MRERQCGIQSVYFRTGVKDVLARFALEAMREFQTRTPNSWYGPLWLAYIYSELGQMDEAQAAAAEVRRLNPDFSLAAYEQAVPFKNHADVERIVTALRKTGLE